MPDYRIRQATVSDAAVIAWPRVGMFSLETSSPTHSAKLAPSYPEN
jgi:hypothetical protein